MSAILGIETSTDVCAVSVEIGGVPVCSVGVDRPRKHAERLVPLMRDALRVAGLVPADLDVVAVSAGPGSYTGLRIGVSAAKGVVLATGARLVPVPSLRALALASGAAPGTTVIAALGARRSEVYAASYRIGADGRPDPVRGPVAGSAGEALSVLAVDMAGTHLVVGSGARILAEELRREGIPFFRDPVTRPTASAVARLGRSESPVDVEQFEPYYLREFTARPASGSVYDRLPF